MLALPAKLRVTRVQFQLMGQTVGGGQAISGFAQTVAGPRARWTAKMTCEVWGEEEILAFRAFLAALDGRANECLVPPRDGIRPRDNGGLMFPQRRETSWAAGPMWFNGGGWALPPIVAAQAFAAAQGATSMTIAQLVGSGVRPGHFFGLADRLYQVLTVVPSATIGGATDLTFRPRLRTAVADNDTVILDVPVCRMRLKSDDSGALELVARQAATPTLEFVESTPAP